MDASALHALASKAGVIWVTAGDRPAAPLWFGWHEDAIHLVVGGTEQPNPFPEFPCLVEVQVPSKETGASVAQLSMTARLLPPGTAAWTAAAAALAPSRLNAGNPDLPEVWATSAHLVTLQAGSPPAPTGRQISLPRSVTIESVRPRGWRAMRAHLRRGGR